MNGPNLQGTLYLQGQTIDIVSFDKDSFVINWSIEAGDTVGTHFHDKMEEHLQMLEGTLEFKMNGKREVRTKGEEILIPPNLVHSIHNVSDNIARCVVTYKPCNDLEKSFAILFSFHPDNRLNLSDLFTYFYIARGLNIKKWFQVHPPIVMKILMLTGYIIGKLAGWDKKVNEFKGKL